MLFFAINNEPGQLALLHDAITEAEPKALIVEFSHAQEAVELIETAGIHPDAVFSDAGVTGYGAPEFSARLNRLSPETILILLPGEGCFQEADDSLKKTETAAFVQAELDRLFNRQGCIR